MPSQLSDEESRIYQLSMEQHISPQNAIMAHRKITAISDPERQAQLRRHLVGHTLPYDPEDDDMADFVAVSKALTHRFEAAQHKSESAVAGVYDDDKMKRFRIFNFLYGADDTIRNIVEKIVDSLPKIQIDPGDVVAVSTTGALDAQFWHVSDVEALRDAIDKTTYEIACDFRLLDDDDIVFGPCMTHHKNRLDSCKKLDKNITPRDYYQREYMREHFFTIPFTYGNIVVLARICDLCLGAFLYANHIDTNKIGYVTPRSDGFGSVGGGPITKSEYQWAQSAIKDVAREFEARNGHSPNLIELQKSLQGAEFLGEGSEGAKKITDKRSKHRKS